MRSGLNELGYSVTKKGSVVYKRRSSPFTLKRIHSIFSRSFWPWWEESASNERLDSIGLIRPSVENYNEYARQFWLWFEEMNAWLSRLNKIQYYFINSGPDLSTISYKPAESAVSGLENLIKQLANLVLYLKKVLKGA